MRPVDARHPITLGYRQRARFDPTYIHRGIDYGCPTGTPVKATTAGKVVHAGWGGMGRAFGVHVVLRTGDVFHIYAHLSSESVSVGQVVAAGAALGKSGATGNTRGAHLHYGEFTSYYYKADRKPRFITATGGSPAPSTDRMDPASYFLGATGPHVKWLDERLLEHDIDITVSTTYTEADVRAVAEFQRRQGWTGPDADGFPGHETLKRLAADPSDEPPASPAPPPAAVRIIPRSEWTSTENGRANRPLSVSKVTAFTVHYPGDGDVTYADLTEREVAAKLRGYREHHLKRGWSDIGYNYAIDQAGRVWFLTGDTIGAHSGPEGNPTSIGVLFVVGNNEEPTPAAVAAFRALRAVKRERFTRASKVQGHQQVPGNATSCPGEPLMALVRAGTLTDPKPAPDPEPAPSKVEQSRWLGENLWADYGNSSYLARLDELNATRHEVRASVVLGCESGPYIDGERLNEAYDWGGNRAGDAETPKGRESFVLHSGDDVRISGSIHFDPDIHRLLDEGWDHTLDKSTHDGITWIVKQHRLSGVVSVAGVLHCVPWPIGPNDIRKWNEQRYDEVSAGLEVLNELRAKVAKDRKLEVVPAVLGEDFNSKRTDSKYPGGDGPGRAFAAHGFADAWTLAKVKLPVGSPGRKALIDRIAVSVEGVTVREHIIVPTRGGTDHPYAVGVALDLTNRKVA